MQDVSQIKDVPAIEKDIRIIVGGNFTPDALGPETHEKVTARARARARDYLLVFESMYLGTKFDALAQSNLHLPAFLKLLRDRDPIAVRRDAQYLLRLYDAVMMIHDQARDKRALLDLLPEEVQRAVARLNDRREQLRGLA